MSVRNQAISTAAINLKVMHGGGCKFNYWEVDGMKRWGRKNLGKISWQQEDHLPTRRSSAQG